MYTLGSRPSSQSVLLNQFSIIVVVVYFFGSHSRYARFHSQCIDAQGGAHRKYCKVLSFCKRGPTENMPVRI